MNSGTSKNSLDKKRKENRKQRMKFIKYWAEYIKEHSDKEWSEQQNTLINSQLKSARKA